MRLSARISIVIPGKCPDWNWKSPWPTVFFAQGPLAGRLRVKKPVADPDRDH